MYRKKLISNIPYFFVFTHSIIVAAMAVFVSTSLAESAESAMAWVVFLLIDFPLGWLLIPIHSYLVPLLLPNASGTVLYVITPLVVFLILGGIQYYFVGKLLVYIIEMRLKNKE